MYTHREIQLIIAENEKLSQENYKYRLLLAGIRCGIENLPGFAEFEEAEAVGAVRQFRVVNGNDESEEM